MKSGNKISFNILSLEVIILMIDMNMLFDQIKMTLKNHMFDMYSNRFLKMQVINFFLIMFFFNVYQHPRHFFNTMHAPTSFSIVLCPLVFPQCYPMTLSSPKIFMGVTL
jgi:hypothetical protein